MKLSDDEREVALAEVAQALDQVRSAALKTAYGELLSAVDRSEVPEDLVEPLQTVLEVGLESGRIRRVHSAHGEMAAQRLYARTPKGRALRASCDDVTGALKALQGAAIEDVALSPQGPGSYSLSLNTDRGRVLVRVDRAGARIQSLEVG
jgi:hypothetical protein